MPDLLLELFSEEIPARMQEKAADDLKKLVTNAAVDAGLTYEGAASFVTPRRLCLHIAGLPARSADTVEEKKGPRVGSPEQALSGFLKAAGLASIDEAEIVTDPKKGEFYVAKIRHQGRPAEEILKEAIEKTIATFPWPKSMRWGSGSLRWVRPLHAVLATFGPETEEPEVIPVAIEGISAGNTTHGHRFMAPGAITVRRFDDYVGALEKAKVILDASRRRDIIAQEATTLAFAQGLEVIEDEGLLAEVAGLVEWPVVLMGSFDEAFLDIPDAVIRATIRANQKCFVLKNPATGRLANKFLLVSNIEASDGGAAIVAGNERVIRARLSDALYFWQTDQKPVPDVGSFATSATGLGLDIAKPLDQRMARLDQLGVVFHAKLGSQGERVRRIADLAAHIAPLVGADPALARRAALLAKADLQTEVVGEFPELQGMMGRIYAERQGEAASVAAAIEDHYKPLGPTDHVPADPVAIAVALADKIDLLTGFFAIDEKPTGSKDPFALRRAALGVVRILVENAVSTALLPLLSRDGARASVAGEVLAFIHDRLKVSLRDAGRRHDVIDAVLARTGGGDDLYRLTGAVAALEDFLGAEDGVNLVAGLKRAANILAAEEKKGTLIGNAIDASLFREPQEMALFEAAREVAEFAALNNAAGDFAGALNWLSRLRAPVDAFFEAVLVNDEDAAVRANRLALVALVRGAGLSVADVTRLAG